MLRFYEVGDGGLLSLVNEESEVMQLASEKPIRVIAQLDKKIFLDPSPFLADHAIQIYVVALFRDCVWKGRTTGVLD